MHAGGGFWGLLAATIIAKGGIAYGIVDAIRGKGGHEVRQALAVDLRVMR